MKINYDPGSIRYWQAKYERYLSAVRSRRSSRRYIQCLETFLSRYRDRKTPDEIYVMDIADFKAARAREGIAPRTIALEVGVIRNFYDWLTEVQDVPTFNPAKRPRKLWPAYPG